VAELRISNAASGFVLYFDTPEPRVNAYAFASTIVALADAAKAAGRTLNSAVDIEVVVEALGQGSFRARISAIVRESGLFVKQQLISGLIIGVMSTYIYDHTLAKRDKIEVKVDENEVVITQGNDRIIVPRDVYNAEQMVAKNPTFVRSMDKMLGSVILDDRVRGFGVTPDIDSPPPALILPRDLLEIRDEPVDPDAKVRVIEEDADLYIVKAIMERSKRKWEFKWHGINISAPIKDPNFYDDFAQHNFTIAPGDEFQAKIAIYQERDDISGVYTNKRYEVLQVYRHVPHLKPTGFRWKNAPPEAKQPL
jgi:hypothetical protein